MTWQKYWEALMKRGIDADIISVNDDFDGYKLILAPMLFSVKPERAEKLKAFVEKGGILSRVSPFFFLMSPCGGSVCIGEVPAPVAVFRGGLIGINRVAIIDKTGIIFRPTLDDMQNHKTLLGRVTFDFHW